MLRGEQTSALREVLLSEQTVALRLGPHALVHRPVAGGQDGRWWGSLRAGGWQGSVAQCATLRLSERGVRWEATTSEARVLTSVLLSAERAGVVGFAQA